MSSRRKPSSKAPAASKAQNSPASRPAEQFLKQDNKSNVTIAWCFGKEVASLFMTSVQVMVNYDMNSGQHIRAVIADHSHVNITNTRNNLIKKFLNEGQAEWLLMLDTDMIVPPNLIEILLSRANNDPNSPDYTPFIGGLCFSVNGTGTFFPTLYDWTPEGHEETIQWRSEYPDNELIEVGASGAACMLMHKDALIRIYQAHQYDIFPWFKEYEYRGTAMSEDFGLCLRAKQLGYKIRVHTGAKTGHFKPFVIDESMYIRQREGDKLLGIAPSHAQIKE